MFEKILIKKRLRECREKCKLFRPQAAKLAGIPFSTLVKWETEPDHVPKLDRVAKLAEVYGVSLDYIVGRTDNPEVNK